MSRSAHVGNIRAILGEALGTAGSRKKKRRPAANASGNVVNLKMPSVRCSGENCQCESALRVTLALILGFGIASFIFGVTVVTLKFVL